MGANGSQQLQLEIKRSKQIQQEIKQQIQEDIKLAKKVAYNNVPGLGPLRVAVVGATGQVGYALLPMIASGNTFGRHRRLALQCLELNHPAVRDKMNATEMELWDGNFELLQQVIFTMDDAVAFEDADYAILLGSFPAPDGSDKKETMEMNSIIFRTLGNSISRYAKRDCKVLVVGPPSCANALLCAHHAPSVPKENITAVTCLPQNRAAWQLAQKAGVHVGAVRNVIIWGTLAHPPDVDHAEINGKPAKQVLHEDGPWLQEGLPAATQERGWSVVEARQASAALSAARATVNHAKALHCGTAPGEYISMGVWTDGNDYGISDGLIFSMPVQCLSRGSYQIVSGLKVSKRTRKIIKEAEAALLQDRALMLSVLDRHRQVPVAPQSRPSADSN